MSDTIVHGILAISDTTIVDDTTTTEPLIGHYFLALIEIHTYFECDFGGIVSMQTLTEVHLTAGGGQGTTTAFVLEVDA
jgi:hypothetical protein